MLTYLSFADEKRRMSRGSKALNQQEWIEIDQHFVEELTLKDNLLNNHYSHIFANLPASQTNQQEILDLLINYLLDHFPQYYRQ